jgi:hypothetical protein
MRNDAAQEPEYPAALERLSEAGSWRHKFSTESFQSMPYGEPSISRRVYVYQKFGGQET